MSRYRVGDRAAAQNQCGDLKYKTEVQNLK